MTDKKTIKAAIRKQLKNQIKNWNKMKKKDKKLLLKQIMDEVKVRYENNDLPSFSSDELLNITPITEDMMTLDDINEMKKVLSKSIAHYMDHRNTAYLKNDKELSLINELLDDVILNELLAHPNYSPGLREKTPAMFFRAELLHALKWAELSYRKFCKEEVNDLERKKNRTFIGLPLHRNLSIFHTELCAFRTSLTMTQQLNVLIYIISLFFESGLVDDDIVWGLDGSDLAAYMNTNPLATVTVMINGRKEKISVFDQLDTDRGERRSKSDRSRFFVGYKMHRA